MKIKKQHILVSLIALVTFSASNLALSQYQKTYYAEPVTDTIPPSIHTQLKTNLIASKQRFTQEKSKVANFASEITERQFDYVVKSFNRDLFITEGQLASHINKLTTKILLANKELARDIRVYAFRSDEPNAVSFGNGIISIMLGLLQRLENDDQLAFIICHEMAHLYLDHTHKRILDVARLNFDKELRKKFNEARRSEFHSYTKLKELMASIDLALNRYGQKHEFQADSLGFIFMRQAGFRASGALSCMRVLDNAEKPLNASLLDLAKHFQNPQYPIKENWIKYEKSTTWHKSNVIPDSAKTHPSCKLRATAIKRQLLHVGLDTASEESSPFQFAMNSRFELIESHYHLKDYGKSLFHALLLLEEYPENGYLQGMISKSIWQIYAHQKRHELGKVVTMPDPRFPENYDRVLTFIQALRLNELAALTYHYITSRPASSFTNEHVLYSLWLVSFLDVSTLNPDSIKADYADQFPNGRYIQDMKSNPTF